MKKKSLANKSKKKPASSKKTLNKPMKHNQLLELLKINVPVGDGETLGHDRAVVIVCACANTSPLNLSRTLDELGVDGQSFQACVHNSVTSLGYELDLDDI